MPGITPEIVATSLELLELSEKATNAVTLWAVAGEIRGAETQARG